MSVVFPAGVTERSVAILISDDTVLEGVQSFSVEISPLSSGVAVDGGSATVLIEDNDGKWLVLLCRRYTRCIVETLRTLSLCDSNSHRDYGGISD